MISINDNKIILEVSGDPQEYLENLRDAIFHALKVQALAGGNENPDPEGHNAFLLDFYRDSERNNLGLINTHLLSKLCEDHSELTLDVAFDTIIKIRVLLRGMEIAVSTGHNFTKQCDELVAKIFEQGILRLTYEYEAKRTESPTQPEQN